jgi:hypothetical protein
MAQPLPPMVSLGSHVTPGLIAALREAFPDKCPSPEEMGTPAALSRAYAVDFIRHLDRCMKAYEQHARAAVVPSP